MGMSKKDFQEFATRWGTKARIHGWTPETAPTPFIETVNVAKNVFRWSNSAFDSDRFDEWLWDVAAGRRNADGKRVKR